MTPAHSPEVLNDPRWRIHMAEHQIVLKGQRYEWDNATREPDQFVIKLVLRGHLPFCRDGDATVVTAGQVLRFRHGENSSYGWPGPASETLEIHWLACSGAGLREHWDWLDQQGGPVLTPEPGSTLPELLSTCIARHRQDPHALDHGPRIHHLLQAYGSIQERRRLATLSPLERAVERLHQQPLSVADITTLAHHAGVTREHFCRLFRAIHGQSPGRWLHHQRLDHATRLLRDSDLTVSDIARHCGFASANALARALRVHCGHGPKYLRQKLRGN